MKRMAPPKKKALGPSPTACEPAAESRDITPSADAPRPGARRIPYPREILGDEANLEFLHGLVELCIARIDEIERERAKSKTSRAPNQTS
jgi:hypothetical protein